MESTQIQIENSTFFSYYPRFIATKHSSLNNFALNAFELTTHNLFCLNSLFF